MSSTSQNAYAEGAAEALDTFGVRMASAHMAQRGSDGPPHLGAEWLARRLSREQDDHSQIVGTRPTHRRLEKPTTWGTPSSLEASGTNAHNYAGMSQYGGV